MTLNSNIITDYLSKYPDAPTLTIAKMVYRDNVSVFPTLDSARSSVRYYRGQIGRRSRKKLMNRSFMKEPGKRNPFGLLPDGLTDLSEAEPFIVNGKKSLILADVHIPYHDKGSLITALEDGKKEGVDTIILLGDFMDFYSISRWEKDPRRRDFQAELDVYLEVMDVIRSEFKTESIVYLIGNHEERLEKYIRIKAPELYDCNYINFETFFEADKYNMQVVKNKRILKIGSLNLVHGHEMNISRGVVPARTLYLKGKQKALMGHLHTTTDFSTKKMGGEVVSCWSVGCLCDLRPAYAPMNEWNHGFAIVEQFDEKNFRVHNKKILYGRIY